MFDETYKKKVLDAHKKARGKIEILPRIRMDTAEELTMYYTPGVAYVAEAVAKDRNLAFEYTSKANSVAIITDGTRLLGLGDVGPYAAITVMESKSVIYKRFAGVDAVPLCLATKDEDEIINICKNIEPSFGGIHLEDIKSPKVFMIHKVLSETLDIPVFHDDRHGTAVVTLAGVINSLKLAEKKMSDSKIVINGAGAAGMGIVELLKTAGAKNLFVLDSAGLIYKNREENMNEFKENIADYTNRKRISGKLSDIIDGTDIFISAVPFFAFESSNIGRMNEKPIIFALSNPKPEISYSEAKSSGAFIAATGRSDTPNSLNNMICYPPIMMGLLSVRAKASNDKVMLAAAKALAKSVGHKLNRENIIPTISKNNPLLFMPNIAAAVAQEVTKEKLARIDIEPNEVKKQIKERIKRSMRIEKKVL